MVYIATTTYYVIQWITYFVWNLVFFTLQEKRTALHFGAENSHISVVEALIRLGANVNVEVSSMYT